MYIEEWVLYALEQHQWNPHAARESLADGLSNLNPPLAYYQERCALAAKERWRRAIQAVGVDKLAEQEADVIAEMGPLLAHLRGEDAEEVRIEEERHYRILHPRQFTGFKKKEPGG